jgi:hypothetical protein
MSFPRTLADELLKWGCSPTGKLAFSLPSGSGSVCWHISFRTLGFAKDQIDGTLRYCHRTATPFGWYCLSHFAGARWKDSIADDLKLLSGGFAIGPVAGWRSNFTFDNRGLSPDEAARGVAADIQSRVMPFIAGVQTDQQLLHLLTSDAEPYPWFRSQSLARLAEVALLEARLGDPGHRVLSLASRFAPMLQDQLDGVELPQYVEGVLAAAQRDVSQDEGRS